MRKFILALLFPALSATAATGFSIAGSLRSATYIDGKPGGGDYLYVTASPKIYSIGNQRGGFPAVGFHITGEMGGIWMHPIKLLDGFDFSVGGTALKTADSFRTYPYASQFTYQTPQAKVTRTDFAADDMPVVISELTIENTTPRRMTFSVTAAVKSNLMGTWLSEREGIANGADRLVSFAGNRAVIKDDKNNWFAGALLAGAGKARLLPTATDGKKLTAPISGSVAIAPHSTATVRLFLSGSLKSAADASEQLSKASASLAQLVGAKRDRYAQIDSTAVLDIPDSRLQQAYNWGKYTTDWLVRDVPGMGRGISAGLPDYPWFFSNDQSATFNAILGTRQADIMKESMRMLMRHSDMANGDNGRIIHEMSSNGAVYDKGRMEESQGFNNAAWNIYRWTGDRQFLSEIYTRALKTYDFLMANDKDHDLFVEGYGGVEIEGLNDEMFDVACRTAEFLRDMHDMAAETGDMQRANMFALKADTLTERINRLWWCDKDSRYYDMLTDRKTALWLIDKALANWTSPDRNRWAIRHLTSLRDSINNGSYTSNGYNIFYNPSTIALTTGVADTLKARRYLKSVPFFCNRFGLYISGISRPDDIHLEEGSVAARLKGDFNYKEAIMVGATSNLAIAECMYNGADASMSYIDMILNNFNFATPGTTYEVCPDYGMFVQAWNVGGINIPIIQHFFGIRPMASHKTVDVCPDMPSAWHSASIKNVLIGDNSLSVSMKSDSSRATAEGQTVSYTVCSRQPGWTINFRLPDAAHNVSLNGRTLSGDSRQVVMRGTRNTIEFSL